MTKILTGQQQILNSVPDSPREALTIVGVLRMRARQHPERCAFTFQGDGVEPEDRFTYHDLDLQARAVGASLQENGMRGENALLLFQPGLDFIKAYFGCLYAGAVPIPAYPPHLASLDRTLPKIRAVFQDADPRLLLASPNILDREKDLCAAAPELGKAEWTGVADTDTSLARHWADPGINGEALAFLQYTSGSTALPRGVMVTHANIMADSAVIQEKFETSEDTRGVFWLPFYHDMGLVGGILQTVYCGCQTAFFSPLSFIQHPIRWLETISQTRGTVSGGPNFAYELCVRKITPEQRAKLDLSSWTLAFSGAEPVRIQTLEKFAETFEPCGFKREALYPCYGLAESTLMVSGGKLLSYPAVCEIKETELGRGQTQEKASGCKEARRLVSCGRPPQGIDLVIIDPESGKKRPEGQVGEIWVSGQIVARGYWNRPEETAETFRGYCSETGEGPFLRTGDLGFILNGELFVTGRLKDLIIVEGRNHYPQDIEISVEQAHPALRTDFCAAFSVDLSGKERLIVAGEIEPRYLRGRVGMNGKTNGNGHGKTNGKTSPSRNGSAPLDRDEVTRAIRRAVAENHEITVHNVLLLKPGEISKTSSGKIQRHACRDGFLEGTLELV